MLNIRASNIINKHNETMNNPRRLKDEENPKKESFERPKIEFIY